MKKEMTMNTDSNGTRPIRWIAVAVAIGLAGLVAPALPAASPTPSSTAQKSFASPDQAVEAAVEAAAADDVPALLAIFGPEGKDLITSGDAVQDKKGRAEFVRLAREKTNIVKDPSDAHRVWVSVGNDAWPYAVPIDEKNGKWMWNSKEGRYEILLRHIGENELDAITVCRGFVEAQHDYALADPGKTGVHQYAQRIISTPGKHDGLYWKSEEGGPESPIGEAVAKAIAEGYSKRGEPFHGYYYKVLTAQGKAAPLGQLDYVIRGYMIGGFALVAWPAKYRVTGVKTFIVGYDGIVYEKDLGTDTAKIASAMTRYNPDKSWAVTEDEGSDARDDGD
jgi:Protein of unknown function (DUF2950)